MPLRHNPARIDGVEHECFPYDCYQQPRLAPLVPRGLGPLFYGPTVLRYYRNRLPRDGSIAIMPPHERQLSQMIDRLVAERAENIA